MYIVAGFWRQCKLFIFKHVDVIGKLFIFKTSTLWKFGTRIGNRLGTQLVKVHVQPFRELAFKINPDFWIAIGWANIGLSFFLSFFLYILPGARFRALSAGVHLTLRVAGWKPTSNHIEITVGFFNLHKGWLSLHRGHPVNVPIRRTVHLSRAIPANDTRESVWL